MKSNNFKWLTLLLVMAVSTMGAMAQGPIGLIETLADTALLNSTKTYGVINNPSSTYKWSIKPTTGGVITGTSSTISVNWTLPGNFTLTLVEQNSLLCEGDSIKLAITVLPELIPGTIATNQTICYNVFPAPLTSVNGTGGTGNYTYQWQSSVDNENFVNINGATLADFAPGQLTATTYYHLNQTSGSGGTVTTNVVTITVLPILIAPVISLDQTICSNAIPSELTMPTVPTGGNNSFSYQWQSSTNSTSGWANIINATSTSYAPVALTSTTYYQLIVTATGTQVCGIFPASNVIGITVNPIPTTSAIYHN